MRKILLPLLLLPFPAMAGEVLFYEDVAPILVRHCVKCHRTGEVAPFPLVTYEDAKSKASLVRYVTQTRYMPPWIADPGYRRYENERLLSEQEIGIIRDWVMQGRKEGDKRKMPPLPDYAHNSLVGRKPDLTLEMKEPFKLQGTGKEVFTVYKFPGKAPPNTSAMAIEFIPGNRRLVHHVNYYVLEIDPSVDHYQGEYSFEVELTASFEEIVRRTGLMPPSGNIPRVTYYGGWVPGMSPAVYGGGFGIPLPEKFVILANTIHYDATPVDDADQSRFYIFFKDKAVTRAVDIVMIGSGGGVSEIVPKLTIPPNEVRKFNTSWKIPADISIMYAAPHMHLLGYSYLAYAVTPEMTRIPLIKIDRWDFNWQEMYKFNPMVRLPKGSIVHVEGVYDNTSANPFNPFNPPQTIVSTGGMGTRNEMLNLLMLFLPYQSGDENRVLE